MKIIFLDHDGPMCTEPYWGSRFVDNTKFDKFDPLCVKALNYILKTYEDCEIVVTSDWRLYEDLDYMKQYYKDSSIEKSPIGYTDVSRSEQSSLIKRGEEISKYIEDNEISDYIVIDDLNLFRFFEPKNFVFITEPRYGIARNHIIDEIINKLKNE